MSDAIISRIDEMGTRVDDLEKAITELMHNAGQSGAAPPAGK
jgi:heat shock factor-binding protein 1